MRTILKTLILSCLLTGCIITQHNGLHNIINKNLIVYQKQELVEFDNVAAIFKEYANLVNSKKYKTTEDLKLDTKKFIERIESSNISNNYPVKASVGEIHIAKEFLKDVIIYLEKQDIASKDFSNYINQALKFYVTEIIYYEKKVPQ
jgi:hypothetical protein